VPNPDRCQRFEPNAFKKEKCKNCGRPWQEHLGVISQELVDGYVQAKQKATSEREKKEAEAKAKARAKAVAKKKAVQAVEDEWFFDGPKDDNAMGDDSEDDDQAFRMFSRDDLDSAPIERRQARGSETNKPLKVVNLIDFGECNVTEEPMSFGAAAASSSDRGLGGVTHRLSCPSLLPFAGKPSAGSAGSDSPILASTSRRSEPALSLHSLGPPMDAEFPQQELESELQHLRQMLKDANEEKSIQMEIAGDEVAAKQQVIDTLSRERSDMQEQLISVREQLRVSEARNATDRANLLRQASDVERERSAADGLRAEVSRQRAEMEALRAEFSSPSPFAEKRHKDSMDAAVAQAELASAAASREVDEALEAANMRTEELTKEVKEARLELDVAHAQVRQLSGMIKVEDCDTAAEDAALAAAQRRAAQALREVRLKAESQLAWISRRVRPVQHQNNIGWPDGIPRTVAVGGGC